MYHWSMKYYKRRLLPCRKKSLSAADDEGYQTKVGRTRSRAGADCEKARSRLRAGWGRLGAGQEQCKSREEARVGQEH